MSSIKFLMASLAALSTFLAIQAGPMPKNGMKLGPIRVVPISEEQYKNILEFSKKKGTISEAGLVRSLGPISLDFTTITKPLTSGWNHLLRLAGLNNEENRANPEQVPNKYEGVPLCVIKTSNLIDKDFPRKGRVGRSDSNYLWYPQDDQGSENSWENSNHYNYGYQYGSEHDEYNEDMDSRQYAFNDYDDSNNDRDIYDGYGPENGYNGYYDPSEYSHHSGNDPKRPIINCLVVVKGKKPFLKPASADPSYPHHHDPYDFNPYDHYSNSYEQYDHYPNSYPDPYHYQYPPRYSSMPPPPSYSPPPPSYSPPPPSHSPPPPSHSPPPPSYSPPPPPPQPSFPAPPSSVPTSTFATSTPFPQQPTIPPHDSNTESIGMENPSYQQPSTAQQDEPVVVYVPWEEYFTADGQVNPKYKTESENPPPTAQQRNLKSDYKERSYQIEGDPGIAKKDIKRNLPDSEPSIPLIRKLRRPLSILKIPSGVKSYKKSHSLLRRDYDYKELLAEENLGRSAQKPLQKIPKTKKRKANTGLGRQIGYKQLIPLNPQMAQSAYFLGSGYPSTQGAELNTFTVGGLYPYAGGALGTYGASAFSPYATGGLNPYAAVAVSPYGVDSRYGSYPNYLSSYAGYYGEEQSGNEGEDDDFDYGYDYEAEDDGYYEGSNDAPPEEYNNSYEASDEFEPTDDTSAENMDEGSLEEYD